MTLTRQTITTIATCALVMTAVLFRPIDVKAQTMAEYTAIPFSVPEVAAPNVLLLMDASGTIKKRAAMETNGGTWTETATYFGILDAMKCYTYDSADSRFEASGAAKAAIDSACASTLWDGNFLNWISFRRYDAITVAMIGGVCIGGRNANGTCIPNGSPAKPTIAVQKTWNTSRNGHTTTGSVTTGAGVGNLNGRVPTSVQSGASSLVFHLRGGTSGMQGSFCTDNDTIQLIDTETSCSGDQWDDINGDKVQDPGEVAPDSDAYAEQQFFMHVVVDSEPTGVIQEVGTNARFGLMLYSSGAHGFLAVPVGSRQTRDYLGTTVETFESNTVAMIDAVEEAYPSGGTPIREIVYGAMRYYAQVPTTYSKGFHTVAYSPAVALGASGTGSLGPGEINVLTGSETCPSGYLTDACGRDPNFFGSDHTPPWAYPSAQVACCENYVILFWDGIPSGGGSPLPAALQDYGHSVHGVHGSLDDKVYDMVGIAHWANIHDLRQATIPVISEAGHDLSDFQNVTTYAFLAFGDADGRAAMQEVAKYGGFEDSDQPGDPGYNEPDKVSEYDKVNNDTGAAGPDGIPDTFFESNNAGEIKDKLTSAFTSIIKGSNSGTSAAILASSSSGEGAIYQSYYFNEEEDSGVRWTGYTQSLFLDALGNLREDTVQDGRLIYEDDHIIVSRFDGTNVLVDRFKDTNGDGKADSSTPFETDVLMKDVKPIWEAGKQLALMDSTARKLLTWTDADNDGVVDAGEQIEFRAASPDNSATLAPYLRAGAAPFTADNIINFIRGDQVAGLRNREQTVDSATKVWKLGDPVNSTLTVVGPPRERFDVIYGDASYTDYFVKYKNRRQVAYQGANDGMLHAFNVGYHHQGDDPATTTKTEHGWFTRAPNDNSSGVALGDELWGFIPQELLPHLQWLTRADYTHVYYVDLKPKVTDARIFTADTDHPNGWGTILIGGFRLGGSCGACVSGTGAPPMQVTADFGSGVETRTFYSAYFALDITNPEADPTLLWSFSTSGLGLSTSYPAVVRTNPAADAKTDNTNAKWYMVVGSGMTEYGGDSTQTATLFAVDLKTGPKNSSGTDIFSSFPSHDTAAFMADLISLDKDLDYRVDTTYVGDTFSAASSPTWRGKMFRLTTGGGNPSTSTWGVNEGGRVPTELLATFTCFPKPCSGSTRVGPITAAPTVTLDDSGQFWVFFGTGRFFNSNDQGLTETQYFIGVKDPVMSGSCTESSFFNCEQNNLVNVSDATICVVCDGSTNQVTGISGVTTLLGSTTDTLQGLIQSKDGWWTSMPAAGERVLVSPTLFGGSVFFPSYLPGDGGSACGTFTAGGSLYALFYRTGSAYTESIIGTETVGGNTNALRSIALTGGGIASQVALHIGASGTGSDGAVGGGGGCQGQITGFMQDSTGTLSKVCTKPALTSWSRFITYLLQRD